MICYAQMLDDENTFYVKQTYTIKKLKETLLEAEEYKSFTASSIHLTFALTQ